MKLRYFAAVLFCFALAGAVPPASSQEASTVHTIVTATSKSSEDAAPLPRQSITLVENRKAQEVTGWVPLRGPRSGLQLVVLLDDSSRGNLGLQLNDIRTFLNGLPPNARVAIGYMRNGTPNLVQNFTSDHAQAA